MSNLYGPSRACVTGCDAAFFDGAAALLAGVRRHHPDVARFCFVPPAQAEAARARFAGLAEVLMPPRPVAGVSRQHQLKAVRVFAVTVPADVVAWIDSDAVLCRPAPELWAVPPGRVNVVRDRSTCITDMLPPADRPAFAHKYPELAVSRGFNSGVFALRPADWPDLPERFGAVASWLLARDQLLVDQPVLNVVLRESANWLPPAFNAHALFDSSAPAGVRVVHFTGNPKPWMPGYPRHEPAWYYWLRHGLDERDPRRLLAARLRILARTPRRLLSRAARRLPGRWAAFHSPALMR